VPGAVQGTALEHHPNGVALGGKRREHLLGSGARVALMGDEDQERP